MSSGEKSQVTSHDGQAAAVSSWLHLSRQPWSRGGNKKAAAYPRQGISALPGMRRR